MRLPSRRLILSRAMSGRCPRCCQRNLFKSKYRLHECCPNCGLPIEKEDGWSLGAIPLNYAFTCIFWVLPAGLLFATGVISITSALVIAGSGCLVLPVLSYRFSKKLWLGIYYAALPDELGPADKNKGVTDCRTPRD